MTDFSNDIRSSRKPIIKNVNKYTAVNNLYNFYNLNNDTCNRCNNYNNIVFGSGEESYCTICVKVLDRFNEYTKIIEDVKKVITYDKSDKLKMYINNLSSNMYYYFKDYDNMLKSKHNILQKIKYYCFHKTINAIISGCKDTHTFFMRCDILSLFDAGFYEIIRLDDFIIGYNFSYISFISTGCWKDDRGIIKKNIIISIDKDNFKQNKKHVELYINFDYHKSALRDKFINSCSESIYNTLCLCIMDGKSRKTIVNQVYQKHNKCYNNYDDSYNHKNKNILPHIERIDETDWREKSAKSKIESVNIFNCEMKTFIIHEKMRENNMDLSLYEIPDIIKNSYNYETDNDYKITERTDEENKILLDHIINYDYNEHTDDNIYFLESVDKFIHKYYSTGIITCSVCNQRTIINITGKCLKCMFIGNNTSLLINTGINSVINSLTTLDINDPECLYNAISGDMLTYIIASNDVILNEYYRLRRRKQNHVLIYIIDEINKIFFKKDYPSSHQHYINHYSSISKRTDYNDYFLCLFIENKFSEKYNIYHFESEKTIKIDFKIYRYDFYFVFGGNDFYVEIDDPSHILKHNIKKDILKNNYCNDNNIKLFRINIFNIPSDPSMIYDYLQDTYINFETDFYNHITHNS